LTQEQTLVDEIDTKTALCAHWRRSAIRNRPEIPLERNRNRNPINPNPSQ